MQSQIHIRVSEGQKQRWEDYCDNLATEPDTMTQLIRLSVTREINQFETDESGADDLPEEIEIALDTVDERTQGIEQSVEELQQDIQQIRQSVIVTPDVEEIMNDVMALLPDMEPHGFEWENKIREIEPPDPDTLQEIEEWVHDDEPISNEDLKETVAEQLENERTAWTGTVEDIASELEDMNHESVRHDSVRQACNQLERDTGRVRSGTHEGVRYWWVDA